MGGKCARVGLKALPTRAELHKGPFGKPSPNHLFVQAATLDTCMYHVLASGILPYEYFVNLCKVTPTITHLAKQIVQLKNYDFTWIRDEDPYWKKQLTVPQSHARAMMAAMFHYGMHASDVMRFLGGT